MAINDEFELPTEAFKATKSVSGIIRTARVLSAAFLIVGAVPLVFVFPFLFDSPNASPSLILGILIAFPLSFFLSVTPYKKSLKQGNLTKALLFAAAPLLLVGAYVGIAHAINKLTQELVQADAGIVGAENEELFIKTPEKCKPSIFRTRYTIHGAWQPDGEKISFICDGTSSGIDSITIAEAQGSPSVESEVRGYTKLIESDGNLENYSFNKDGRTVAEISTFATYDGHKAYALRWVLSKTPTYLSVSRRLNDVFELKYGIDLGTANRADMADSDRRIVEYVKSIVHRNK